MAKTVLANPSLVINNIAIPIVPNSLSFTEGFGEQTVKTQSSGGGSVESVYADDAETKLSMVKFQLFPTSENITSARDWKSNKNNNAITIVADGGFSRTFQNMAMINNPDINLAADSNVDVEFAGDPAV